MAATLESERPAQTAAPAGHEQWSVPYPSGRLTAVLLAGILVLALGLRLWGLDWGLPWAFHPDEIFYVDQAEDMLRFGDLNPKYFKNPSALTYLIAAELLLTRALGPLAGPFDYALPGAAYLLARLDSALIGTASVALVFAIGARLFDRRVGLLAALFLSVSFLHVRDSHYGVNDVPGTGLLLASLYCAVRILQTPERRWYLLAGFLGGLATSTKYNMGFFFVPIVVAHLLGARAMNPNSLWERVRARAPDRSAKCPERSAALTPCPLSEGEGALPSPPPSPSGRGGQAPVAASLIPLVAAAVASLFGYLLGTPYTLLDFGRFARDFATQYRFGDNRWLGQPLEPVPVLYLYSLAQGFGALLLGLAVVGLGLALWRKREAALLLISFPVVYLAFLMSKELFFPRFTIPLLPILALLAAYAAIELAGLVVRLREQMQDPRRRAVALAALLLATLIQPLASVWMHNQVVSRTDTRILANEWVQANLPPGSRLKIEDYSLRDLSTQARTYTPNTAELKIERMEGSPEAEQARYFAEKNVQYVVTSSFASERYLLEPPTPGQRETGERYRRLHRSLENRAELVAQFGPGRGGAELPYRLDDVMTPFWTLDQYERGGPTIRIYSVENLAGG